MRVLASCGQFRDSFVKAVNLCRQRLRLLCKPLGTRLVVLTLLEQAAAALVAAVELRNQVRHAL